MKIDSNNYMVYVGLSGSNYLKYRELCREHGLQFYSGWKGNVEYYGVLNGDPKALSIDFIDKYTDVTKMSLDIFKLELIRAEDTIDNFSII